MSTASVSVRPRIAVFTGYLNYTVRRNIIDLDCRHGGADWLVLVYSLQRTAGRLGRNQRLNLRKHVWRWIRYQFRDLLTRLIPRREAPVAPGTPAQIYNGVITDRYIPVYPARSDLLPTSWQGKPMFVVGTVGCRQAVKDQAKLVRVPAAAKFSRRALTSQLNPVVAGGGPQRQSLEQLARELGGAESRWFTGARNDVPDLLQQMGLFLLSSLNEGIFNIILAPKATGLPLAVSAVGGKIERVTAGEVGETFAPCDVDRLAAMIESFASQPESGLRQGRAARQRVLSTFSLRAMIANTITCTQSSGARPRRSDRCH